MRFRVIPLYTTNETPQISKSYEILGHSYTYNILKKIQKSFQKLIQSLTGSSEVKLHVLRVTLSMCGHSLAMCIKTVPHS